MVASQIPTIDKVAIVLCSLPPEDADQVLGVMNPIYSGLLREGMESYSNVPNLEELKDEVLAEFANLQQSLREERAQALRAEMARAAAEGYAITEQLEAGGIADEEANDVIEDTGDPLKDIRSLTADQLVSALRSEHPRTIAIVLHHVTPEAAADVVSRLPPQTRRETFVEMSKGLPDNNDLVLRVVYAVIDACREREQSTVSGSKIFKALAELLHAVDRGHREEMMEALQAVDVDAAAKVDDLLFNFEDLVGIETGSLQGILADIAFAELAIALFRAPKELNEKIFGAVSSRNQEKLNEEMQYLVNRPPTPERVQLARRRVVDEIRKKDKEQKVVWEVEETGDRRM